MLKLGPYRIPLRAPELRLLRKSHRQNPDLADQGVSDAVLRTTVYVTCAVGLTWSAAAVVLAVLAWRRVRWGAAGLLASAGAAGCFCLLVVVGSFVLLLPLIACGATVAFLIRPEARRWFAPRGQGCRHHEPLGLTGCRRRASS